LIGYLRQILGFIGIVDVQTSIRIEGMNIPALAPNAVPKANKAVGALAL
jgi:FMN-dependent NADH-azoreductase